MHIHISRCDNSLFVQDLASHLFGNPHSQHGWSGNEGSAQAVAEARQLTLQMCNAPLGEYECVFTSGATGALHSTDHSPLPSSLIRILSHEQFESWSELLLTVDWKDSIWTPIHCAAKLQGLQPHQAHNNVEIFLLYIVYVAWLSRSCRGIGLVCRGSLWQEGLTIFCKVAGALNLVAEALHLQQVHSFAHCCGGITDSCRSAQLAKQLIMFHSAAGPLKLVAGAFPWQEGS